MVRWLLSLTLLGSALSVPPAFQGGESRFQNLTRLGVLGSGLGAVAQSPQPPTQSNRVGLASWYGGGEHFNSHVAMGHRFDPEVLEAAMWDIPFGTIVKVTNLENGRTIANSHPDIVTRINHPGVPTIYPPVAQAVFSLTQWAVPWSLRGVRVMSVVFDSLCVLLIIVILKQLALPLSRVLIYAWSPLVLKEFANSGHMDTSAMAMVLLSLLLLLRRRWGLSGAALALGVAGKYYPLVLVPLMGQRAWREGRGVFYRWGIAFLGTLALCFAPLLGDELRVFRGLGLYAGTWELNAGLFSLVQSLARLVAGDVAPDATRFLLGGLMLAALVWSLRRPPAVRDDVGLIARCVFVIGVLFLLSPVQTPWYLCWMVPLLCVAPSRAWLLLSGLLLGYYLGFFVEYHYAEPQRGVLWNAVKALEYAPFFGLVLWQWVRQRQQVSDEDRRVVAGARPALAARAVPRVG